MSLRRFIFLLLPWLFLTACDEKLNYDHQAYVWQRVWRPSHQPALMQSKTAISQLRVLATQFHPRTGWRDAAIDLDLLAQDQRPVTLVIRIDGSTTPTQAQPLKAKTRQLISLWREGSVKLAGVEIDFDCPSSQLLSYAQLLNGLRSEMTADLRLSITALPTWLQNAELDPLLAIVDETVLQVHSLTNPQSGLFDPLLAEQWATSWSQRTTKDFFLALPSYSSEVIATVDGDVIVESESPLQSAIKGREIVSDPYVLAAFIQKLHKVNLNHLKGVLWFRLPLADDYRAWPWQTLNAVILQQALRADVKVNVDFKPSAHYADLSVLNNGNAPANLLPIIEFDVSDCLGGDGLSGYSLEINKAKAILRPIGQTIPLQAGKQRVVGWLNCKTIKQEK